MKQIFSVVLLVLLLTVSAASDVYATEVDGQEEMSEEEKRQEQLDAIYSMPVQSNEIAGWPQGRCV